jgi:hypothetical protein
VRSFLVLILFIIYLHNNADEPTMDVVADSLASLLWACRVYSVWLMRTSGMVLLSIHVVCVKIRRITLPQEPFMCTYFSMVSCPTKIVGPSTEKEGLQ